MESVNLHKSYGFLRHVLFFHAFTFYLESVIFDFLLLQFICRYISNKYHLSGKALRHRHPSVSTDVAMKGFLGRMSETCIYAPFQKHNFSKSILQKRDNFINKTGIALKLPQNACRPNVSKHESHASNTTKKDAFFKFIDNCEL